MPEMFNEGGLRITTMQVEYGSSTYPLPLIEDSTPVRMSPDIITFLLNAGIGVGGLFLVFMGVVVHGFSLPEIIMGALLAAWGWFIGKGVLKVDHFLTIDFHDGRSLKIKSPDFAFIERAHGALVEARRS